MGSRSPCTLAISQKSSAKKSHDAKKLAEKIRSTSLHCMSKSVVNIS